MLGLSTTPSLEMYELAVIGGGPAGLAAAVYGASEGLKTVLIESTTTGGQAGRSSRIENYLGFPTGVSGAELTTSARRQAERFGAEVITTRKAVGLDVSGQARIDQVRRRQHHRRPGRHPGHRRRLPPAAGPWLLGRPGQHRLQLHRPRRLLRRLGVGRIGVCGRRRLHRRRRELGGSGGDVHVARGQVGDAAHPRAVARCVDVLLSHPADRGQETNIHVRTCTEVVEATGEDDHLTSLVLREQADRTSGRRSWPRACAASSARRRAPSGSTVSWPATTYGFILSGPDLQDVCGWTLDRPPHHLETSVPGVFVAGDVRAESAKRVAAAVGEGSMAVMLVHRYLAEA